METTSAHKPQLQHALQPHLKEWGERGKRSRLARQNEINGLVAKMKIALRAGVTAFSPKTKQAYLEHEMSGPLNGDNHKKLNGLHTHNEFVEWISKHGRELKLKHCLPDDVRLAMQHDVVLTWPSDVPHKFLRFGDQQLLARFDIDATTYDTLRDEIIASARAIEDELTFKLSDDEGEESSPSDGEFGCHYPTYTYPSLSDPTAWLWTVDESLAGANVPAAMPTKSQARRITK